MREISIIISIWGEINFRKYPMIASGRVGRLNIIENVDRVFVYSLEDWTQNLFEGLGSCNLMVSVKNDNAGDYTIIKFCVGSINNHLS